MDASDEMDVATNVVTRLPWPAGMGAAVFPVIAMALTQATRRHRFRCHAKGSTLEAAMAITRERSSTAGSARVARSNLHVL